MEIHRRPQPGVKSFWARWGSLAVKNGTQQRNWESPDERSKIAHIIIPWSELNDVQTELYVGPSGCHLGVNNTPDTFFFLQSVLAHSGNFVKDAHSDM
jgi:hypothetical protein